MKPFEPLPLQSTATLTTSFDGKRQPRLKETQFVYKHGQRHHTHDPEKAPYPLSYDRHVLELEALDLRLVKHLRGSASFVNFRDGPPEHSLDLGCGTGTWVLDAAQEWPNCEFVGFDLVNIQIPLKLVDPSVAQRISWVHGNFLTTKLPFEEDEFDHVRINSIARGVPENKWGVLFDEINRILRPGGAVEVSEDDIVFPLLPRWFTAPLRARPRRGSSVHLPDGSQRSARPPTPDPPPDTIPPHDHALLESLYKAVFEHRFINLNPTAVLPIYFTTIFRQVTLGPVINFPMPPLPPLQPLPPQIVTALTLDPNTDTLDPRSSIMFSPPMTRPTSLSLSSSLSASTASTTDSHLTSIFSICTRTNSGRSSSCEPQDASTSKYAANGEDNFFTKMPPIPFKRFILDHSLAETTSSVSTPAQALLPIDQLAALNERSLAMHLYISFQNVLACQEAMWEELKYRIRNRKDELKPYGWEDDEELEELQSRKKFERLIERYRGDMLARISLWCSLARIGWPFPAREPLSKAELIEEERIRDGMMEARRYASAEDLQAPCRAVRVLVGYKSCC